MKINYKNEMIFNFNINTLVYQILKLMNTIV